MKTERILNAILTGMDAVKVGCGVVAFVSGLAWFVLVACGY